MIRAAAQYMGSIPAVFIDGFIYVAIAFFGAWTAALGTDEAAKYMEAQTLFWARSICASISAGALALKMFRSTSYGDHQQKKKEGTAPPFKV